MPYEEDHRGIPGLFQAPDPWNGAEADSGESGTEGEIPEGMITKGKVTVPVGFWITFLSNTFWDVYLNKSRRICINSYWD